MSAPEPGPVAARTTDAAPGTTLVDLDYLGREEAIAAALLETDDGLVVIDPGPSVTIPTLRRALADRGAGLDDLSALLLTHIHLDHAGAAGTLARACPRLAVHVHERGAPHLVDPSRLLESARRIYRDRMDELWGEFAPVPADRIRVLAGGESLAPGGRRLEVAYTPGHAWHHVSVLDPATGLAFVGDVVGERYPSGTPAVPATPPPDVDLETLDRSIETIRRWEPRALVLTHFGLVADVEGHIAEHAAAVEDWSRRVRASLDDPGTDDERAARFAGEVGAELGREATERGRERIKATSLAMSWSGLARYWRKRDATGG